ncbi:VOC family protein [Celerinatantimonas yamalensis]|uniref:VOC family protein n=1 Tax=Celerinatantimonas yamalensis TaxID=559956 RepID=A0ABW9G907_9GAMM
MTLNAHLSHLALGSPAPLAMATFYENTMGNTTEEIDQGFISSGPGRKLLFTSGGAKELKYFAMGMSQKDLDALREALLIKHIPLSPSPSPLFDDKAFALQDPDGNWLTFGVEEKNNPQTDLPARIQHCAFATTNIERMLDFYQNTIGYLVSDNVFDEHQKLTTTFLRSDHEHHALAIFQAKEKWFDHHCYESSNWNAIRDWADHLSTFDIPLQWGPGRHGPGNNLFIFIHDPDGNWLEISAELQTISADAPTGEWIHESKTLNYWGQAFLRN